MKESLMDQVLDFFKNLGDVSERPACWDCGPWSEFHRWLYLISDLLIWSAFIAIPVLILYFINRKRHYRFLKLYFLFAAFILICGSTYLMDVILFWWPAYRISALIRFITGVISWGTVIYVIRIMPQAFTLKSSTLLIEEINKRKIVEEDLQLKINQLREAEKLGHFGNFSMYLENGKVEWSDGMGLLFDVDDVSKITRLSDYMQFLPEREKAIAENFVKKAVSGTDFGPYYQEIRTAKGEQRILYLKGRTIYEDGKAVSISGTAQDVTEIRKNKEQLEDSKQLFKNAFLYSSLGMALVSLEGEVIDLNYSICRITNYTDEEFRQKNFFDLIHPDHKDETLADLDKLLSRESEFFQREKKVITGTGEEIWTLFSEIVVWKADNPSFYIFQIADITENKKMFHEIKDQNTELAKVNRELEVHISNTNEFNRIISHNLKGPATSLVQLADFIEQADNEEDKIFLNSKIKDTAGLITTTLDDLKNFIEIKLGSHEPVISSIKEALNYTYKLLQPNIEKLNPQISLDLKVDLVKFPKVYLESIMYNLLSNSLKYVDGQRPTVISISSTTEGDEDVLIIKDNGIGIDLKKYGSEIFKYKKIFHRGYDSYGMGLFLVKTQVEEYGGKIEIDSEINDGTTFTIRLKR